VIAPPRVALSETTTSALRQVAAKTGLTPNVVARFAMLVSFEQRHAPAPDMGAADLTINRATLFGEIESFLLAAFLAVHPNADESTTSKLIASHIARGARFLNLRVNSLFDLARLGIV